MSINLKGVFLGCKYGIAAMQRAGGGSIINTASFVGLMGAATPQVAYTASKGGVIALTRELSVIHARENIRVNALCPGPLRTELLMKFLDTEAKKQKDSCIFQWDDSVKPRKWHSQHCFWLPMNHPTQPELNLWWMAELPQLM